MSTLWTITLHPNQEIELKVERPLKISNASLGVNVSDGDAGARTIISLVDGSALPSETSPPVYTAICSLTAMKDHVSLDIVLNKGTCIKFKADGPNDAYLIGYYLAPIEACTVSEPAVSVASVSATQSKKRKPVEANNSSANPNNESVSAPAVSASSIRKQKPVEAAASSGHTSSGNIASAVSRSAKRKRTSAGDQTVDQRPSKQLREPFQSKEMKIGLGDEVEHGCKVTVDIKAFGNGNETLFRHDGLKLALDGSQDMNVWKCCIPGMRVGGRRLIKVPSHWARGQTEVAIKSSFTVRVTLLELEHEDEDESEHEDEDESEHEDKDKSEHEDEDDS
ncbi:hypothetical protein B0H11DRAFT_1905112 [Mycena galericulata]|nr:hypothetical protein B0H11DRAFT_1905112 [Mycena galericulata]